MADERSVSVYSLLVVERLRLPSAFAGVMWTEVGEEAEDALSLLDCGLRDVRPRV